MLSSYAAFVHRTSGQTSISVLFPNFYEIVALCFNFHCDFPWCTALSLSNTAMIFTQYWQHSHNERTWKPHFKDLDGRMPHKEGRYFWSVNRDVLGEPQILYFSPLVFLCTHTCSFVLLKCMLHAFVFDPPPKKTIKDIA